MSDKETPLNIAAIEDFEYALTVLTGTAIAVGAMSVKPTNEDRAEKVSKELQERKRRVIELYLLAITA